MTATATPVPRVTRITREELHRRLVEAVTRLGYDDCGRFVDDARHGLLHDAAAERLWDIWGDVLVEVCDAA